MKIENRQGLLAMCNRRNLTMFPVAWQPKKGLGYKWTLVPLQVYSKAHAKQGPTI